MKNKILFAVLLFGSLAPATAQKIIDKHIPFSPKDFVAMNFQISDSIRIVTWTKNEVYVKSTINVNDNKNNDDYKETFSGSANSVDITAKLVTNCNTYHSRKIRADSGRLSKDSDCCCNCGCPRLRPRARRATRA